MTKIVVTGIGIFTSIGDSLESNRNALLNKISGIGKLENFETTYSKSKLFGEIKLSDKQLKKQLDEYNPILSRTSLLALYSFNEAVKDAGLTAQDISSPDTALIVGNTVGGMCLTDILYQDANAKSNGSPFLNSYDCGSVAIYLQKKFKVGGVVNSINTACSSATNAIMYGARLIQHGLAKKVIVGGVDSLAKFTINGFNSLHILSPEKCAPFSANRQGLNLGEGSAFLVLEAENTSTSSKKYAEVKGFANTNDAFHPSTLSDNGDGPYLAMLAALENANLTPKDIQYINTHGTATENNDLVESRAIMRLYKEQIPAFSSTKANTGHTLGASGTIEAVYCILSLMNQELYPALNFVEPIPETGLIPQLQYEKKPLNNLMSNAFGFGGNCSSIIFSKI